MKKSQGRAGFTLIELLIVVVIIGILAAIAIPKFANTKEKAYMAAMKTDLRNLATAEEGYFADNQTYSTSLSALGDFKASANVTVTVNAANTTGWDAKATHSGVSGKTCVIGVGTGTGASTNGDGVVKCS